MQQKNLKQIIFLTLLILFTACQSKLKSDNKDQDVNKSPIEVYKSYTKQGIFDNEQFLNDNSGSWVCYKYEKDTLAFNDPDSMFDENFAKEFSTYFYFDIAKDTIKYNIYKMPIQCEKVELEAYHNQMDSCSSSLDYFYQIDGKDYMYYSSYQKKMKEKGVSLPYIKSCPIGGEMFCFITYIVINNYGYNWYYKKGKPNKKGIIGMPSNSDSRFIVNKVYKNCTIEQAVYKLIEAFPNGTMELLAFDDEPNMKGEIETWFPKKSCFTNGSSTEYIWKNDKTVTAKVPKTKNSTFIFEFNKKGNDVYVKYWNKVIFPFEDGYERTYWKGSWY